MEKHFGFEATFLPVDRYGMVDPDDVERALRAIPPGYLKDQDVARYHARITYHAGEYVIHDLEARLDDRLTDDGLEAYLPWMGPVATVADYLPEGTAVLARGYVREGRMEVNHTLNLQLLPPPSPPAPA